MKTLKTICMLLTMLAVCSFQNPDKALSSANKTDQTAVQDYEKALIGTWEDDAITAGDMKAKCDMTFKKGGRLKIKFTINASQPNSQFGIMHIKETVTIKGTWTPADNMVVIKINKEDTEVSLNNVSTSDPQVNAALRIMLNEPEFQYMLETQMDRSFKNSFTDLFGALTVKSVNDKELVLKTTDGERVLHKK